MSDRPLIIGIMACDPQGTVGKNNELPWYYEEESEHFRRTTQGHVMIMGRKTFESTPKALFQEHPPIVFSQNKTNPCFKEHTPCILVSSLEEFMSLQGISLQLPWFMIGGVEIAHLFLRHGLLAKFILTKIHKLYQGDTILDLKFFEDWSERILSDSTNYRIYELTNPHFKGNHT